MAGVIVVGIIGGYLFSKKPPVRTRVKIPAEQNMSGNSEKIKKNNSTDADGFMWGTEAGEFYGYPWQTAQINNQVDIINNTFGVNIVKFRLQTKLDHKLTRTEDFSPKICPSSSCFNMDKVAEIFKKNGWSMVPMLSGISDKITSEDIETYANFVDWFVSRYKDDANIKMVELENAPQDWWAGTGKELVEAANKIYDRLKTKYPNILIGTPGLEYSIDKTESELKQEAKKESFETYFMDKNNGAKFDFWAFHGYPVLSPNFVNRQIIKYPPTKIPLKNKYASVAGIMEIRKKMDENGWQNRLIIDTEHVGFAQIGPDFSKKDDEFDSAYILQELILKRTLKLGGRQVLTGIFPLKIVPRGKGGEYQWGSLNSDGSLTNNAKAAANFISLLNEYRHSSHLSGKFDDENTPWIEKFHSNGGGELYIYFKPFKFNKEIGFLDFDGEKLKYEINLPKAPSSVSLIDPITGEKSNLPISQKIIIEAENMPNFLEIKY